LTAIDGDPAIIYEILQQFTVDEHLRARPRLG